MVCGGIVIGTEQALFQIFTVGMVCGGIVTATEQALFQILTMGMRGHSRGGLVSIAEVFAQLIGEAAIHRLEPGAGRGGSSGPLGLSKWSWLQAARALFRVVDFFQASGKPPLVFLAVSPGYAGRTVPGGL